MINTKNVIKRKFEEILALETEMVEIYNNTKMLESAKSRTIATLEMEINEKHAEINRLARKEEMSEIELNELFSEVYITS